MIREPNSTELPRGKPRRLAGWMIVAATLLLNGVCLSDAGAGWEQAAKILASDAAASDYFGVSVSVSGDTAVVGAYYDDDGGNASGAAYVFVREGAGVWTEQQKLTASDAAASDYFGFSVSISGDTAVVGAPRSDDDGGSDSGSAYVFVRSASTWTQQKLTASDAAGGTASGGPSRSRATRRSSGRFMTTMVEQIPVRCMFLCVPLRHGRSRN